MGSSLTGHNLPQPTVFFFSNFPSLRTNCSSSVEHKCPCITLVNNRLYWELMRQDQWVKHDHKILKHWHASIALVPNVPPTQLHNLIIHTQKHCKHIQIISKELHVSKIQQRQNKQKEIVVLSRQNRLIRPVYNTVIKWYDDTFSVHMVIL